MSETGSTTIKSAAFVAVDRAMPQWVRAYAAAKPRIPIHAMARRSSRDRVGSEVRGRANGARTSEPTTSLASASVAGGTLPSVTRVATYEVA